MGRIAPPKVYSGHVISMIGNTMGHRVPMLFKVAQGMVASGQARWEDDPTPLGRAAASEIDRRVAEEEARVAADKEHFERLKAEGAKSVEDVLVSRAQPILIGQDEAGTYLRRPFPPIVIITEEFIDQSGLISRSEDGIITIDLRNGMAEYRVLEDVELPGDDLAFELVTSEETKVDIPPAWRELSALLMTKLAKDLIGAEPKTKMTKADATAIIEEWTATDDQIRAEGSEGEAGAAESQPSEKGKGPEGGNRDKNTEGGNPAEKAKENERKFVHGDDF